MLSAIGYLVGSRVLDPVRLIGVVSDALLDPQDWSIRQLAVTVGTARLKHTVGLDPRAIHADRPQDPERAKTLHWHPTPPLADVLPAWPATGRRGAPPWRLGLRARAERAESPAWPGSTPPPAAPSTTPPLPTVGLDAAPSRLGDADPATWLPASRLIGREVLAQAHAVGRLQDLVFDDADWRVRFLIVTLNERGPTPRRVLVGLDWRDLAAPIGTQTPADQALRLTLDAERLRLSPGFEDVGSIDAALARRLPAPQPHRAPTVLAGG